MPGTILSYGAITTNKVSSLAELITESRSVQVRHGVCQFYPLSILGNLGTAPWPKVPFDRNSCWRFSIRNAGSLVGPPPREGTRDECGKVTVCSLS